MDIYQWLNTTELHPGPESLGDQTCSNVKLSSSKSKRSKIHGESDIAASELELTCVLGVCERKHRLPSCSILSASTRKPASSFSRSSPTSVTLSKCFERRPRRKTRPDLYEPYSGARKRRGRRKESNGEKAASKEEVHIPRYHKTKRIRRGKEKPGQVLMKNFRADNVPQERLTVGVLLAFAPLEGACANVCAS